MKSGIAFGYDRWACPPHKHAKCWHRWHYMCKLNMVQDVAEPSKKAKHVIPVTLFNKWQIQFEKDFSTMTWLWCEKDSSNSYVKTLWCLICRKFESSVEFKHEKLVVQIPKNQQHHWSVKSEQYKIAIWRIIILNNQD